MHAVIGLGSNVGSREAFLRAARDLLDGDEACEVLRRSPMYATPPMGPPQPWFLNAALRVDTCLDAPGLLQQLLAIEKALGRVRRERWGPRSVDLDLLWSDGPAMTTPALQVPHPGLRERAFALAPLLDVAPELQPQYAAALRTLGGPPQAWRPFPDAAGWRAVESPGAEAIESTAEDAPDALAAAITGVLESRQPWRPTRCSESVRATAADAEGLVRAALRRATEGFAVRHVTAMCTERGWEGHLVGAAGRRWRAPAGRPRLDWPASEGTVRVVVELQP